MAKPRSYRATRILGLKDAAGAARRLDSLGISRVPGAGGAPPGMDARNIDALQAVLADANGVIDDAASGRVGIVMQFVNGTPTEQAILRAVVKRLPEKTQELLVNEIHGINPGRDGMSWSMDTEKAISVLNGNAEGVAQNALDMTNDTVRAAGTDLGDQDYIAPSEINGRSISPDETMANAPARYEGDPDAPETEVGDPYGTLNPDDAFVRDPSPFKQPPRETGERAALESRGVKVRLEDRPASRPGPVEVSRVDGYPYIERGQGAKGPYTMGAIKAGREYEDARNARANFVLTELKRQYGGVEGAKKFYQAVQDGDEAAAAILRRLHAQASKQFPLTRPQVTSKVTKEMISPQESYNGMFTSWMSNPSSDRDTLHEMWKMVEEMGPEWKELRRQFPEKRGLGERLGPKATFSSPEEMAEALMKLADDGLFDRSSLTPSQRQAAMEITGGLDPNAATPGTARSLIDNERPDIPTIIDDNYAYRDQVKQRLTNEIIQRWGGSNWGTGKLDDVPLDISESPSAPGSTSNTSRGDLGTEGSVRPTPPNPNDFDEAEYYRQLADYEEKLEQWQYETRPASGYMKSGEFKPTPQPPAPPPRGFKGDAPLVVDPSMIGDPETPWLDGMEKPWDLSPEEYKKRLETRKRPESWMIKDEGSGKKSPEDHDGPNVYQERRRQPGLGRNPEEYAAELAEREQHILNNPHLYPDMVVDGEFADPNFARTSVILRRMDEIRERATNGLLNYTDNAAELADLKAEWEYLKFRLIEAKRADSMSGVMSEAIPSGPPPGRQAQRPPQAQVGTSDPPVVSTSPKPGETPKSKELIALERERDALVAAASRETDRANQAELFSQIKAKEDEIRRLQGGPPTDEMITDGDDGWDPDMGIPEGAVPVRQLPPKNAEAPQPQAAAQPSGADTHVSAVWNASDKEQRRAWLGTRKGTTSRKWDKLTPEEQAAVKRNSGLSGDDPSAPAPQQGSVSPNEQKAQEQWDRLGPKVRTSLMGVDVSHGLGKKKWASLTIDERRRVIEKMFRQSSPAPQTQAGTSMPPPGDPPPPPRNPGDGTTDVDPDLDPDLEPDVDPGIDPDPGSGASAVPDEASLASAAWLNADHRLRDKWLPGAVLNRSWDKLTPEQQAEVIRVAIRGEAPAPRKTAAPDPTVVDADAIDPLESASPVDIPRDSAPSTPEFIPGSTEYYEQQAAKAWGDKAQAASILGVPEDSPVLAKSWDTMTRSERAAWSKAYRKWDEAQIRARNKADAEQEAAANADAKKAPEDAESVKADIETKADAAESALVPVKDQPVPERRPRSWARFAWDNKWKIGLTGAIGAGIANWVANQHDASQYPIDGTGTGPEGMPGGLPVGSGSEGFIPSGTTSGGNIMDQDSFWSPALSSSDRIRLIQEQEKGKFHIPQTMSSWRGTRK